MSKTPPRLFTKLIGYFKNSYLRGELIFAIDILLSLLASLLAIFGIKALAGASFYSTRLIMVYVSAAVVASVAFFLLFRTLSEFLRIRILEPLQGHQDRSPLNLPWRGTEACEDHLRI